MTRWPSLAALLTPVLLAVAVFVTPGDFDATGDADADAVVVLAGATERLPVAVQLAEQGSGVLVISAAEGKVNAPARKLCGSPGDLTVYCFDAAPSTTRGEARAIGRLARQHGWATLTVVTSTYHVPRARLLVERCTAAVKVQGAWPSSSIVRWGRQVAHELGGLTQAAFDSGC